MDNPDRPDDITLPEGWTWERVESERVKWKIRPNFVPVALASGCVAWGTIASIRRARS